MDEKARNLWFQATIDHLSTEDRSLRREGFAVAVAVVIALFIFILILLITIRAWAQSPEASLYHYRATVTDVHDGDTVTVDIDLGFHVWIKAERIRLANINAPELKEAGGIAARDFLKDSLFGKKVIIETLRERDGDDRKEKFGRYLGIIWLDGTNINDLMLSKGYAMPYQGR